MNMIIKNLMKIAKENDERMNKRRKVQRGKTNKRFFGKAPELQMK
jgi:hypothetical protein